MLTTYKLNVFIFRRWSTANTICEITNNAQKINLVAVRKADAEVWEYQ